MKITAFNPIIITKDAEEALSLFEELGFEKRHTKTGINGEDITGIGLRDPNGFHVNITNVDSIPQDITTIRMNVDNFDEAYEFLTAHGFVNVQGDKVTDTGSSKATMMASPSGFTISIAEHIKK